MQAEKLAEHEYLVKYFQVLQNQERDAQPVTYPRTRFEVVYRDLNCFPCS